MSKSNRKSQGRSGSKQASGAVEVVSGSILLSHTTVVTASAQLVLEVAPANFGSRLTAIADLYRLYRFVDLWCDFLVTTTAAERVMMGYASGQITPPTTLIEVSEMNQAICAPQGSTKPVRFHLRRRELAGIVPWFETVGAAGDPLLDTQGSIVISSFVAFAATADNVGVLWHYVVEFKDRLPTAVSLDRLRVMLLPEEGRGDESDTDPETEIVPLPRRNVGFAPVRASSRPKSVPRP